ncbi:MAG: NAD(P)H-dependent oxidoreductase subunit E [Alphaproteobacteria bacterium]|nr:NAD(P)H-dependent oxidoreductase subunit E [Alphaproteobacteria bacterium]
MAKKFQFQNQTEVARAISKYPQGRQASAVLALLDLAQRENQQTHHVTDEAITTIATTLSMPEIRVREVASFFTMINLKPVGKYHLQLCGTTPCMLCGAQQIKQVIMDNLNIGEGETSTDGMFTLTEVECLGACVNAPIVQINDDYYEDITPETMQKLIIDMQNDALPKPGSCAGRLNSAPAGVMQTVGRK